MKENRQIGPSIKDSLDEFAASPAAGDFHLHIMVEVSTERTNGIVIRIDESLLQIRPIYRRIFAAVPAQDRRKAVLPRLFPGSQKTDILPAGPPYLNALFSHSLLLLSRGGCNADLIQSCAAVIIQGVIQPVKIIISAYSRALKPLA